MSTLYFLKVNLNSHIFKVNKGELSLVRILTDLYNKIENGIVVEVESDETVGEGSTKRKVKKKFTYETTDIEKYEKCIYGRIAKKFYTGNEKVVEGKTEEIVVETVVSVPFYIDFNSEILSILNRKRFSPQAFRDVFTMILNKMSDYDFELEFIPNENELDDAIRRVSVVHRLQATVIPDNSINGNEFKEMANMLEDSNITKANFDFTNKHQGIDKSSSLVKNIITSIKNGYGKLALIGTTESGDDISINTEKGIPHQETVDENTRKAPQLLKDAMKKYCHDLNVRRARKRLDE